MSHSQSGHNSQKTHTPERCASGLRTRTEVHPAKTPAVQEPAALKQAPEPFVDADKVAEFLSLTRREVLERARNKEIPGHPLGHGQRKVWRFRLTEVASAVAGLKSTRQSPAPEEETI